ncbi:MAG: YraN family protein [Paracoccaceae bacterium]
MTGSQDRGSVAYRAGLSAEDSIARHYERLGHAVACRRWRGRSGEIDLIARDGDALIFVEVKHSRDFARAAGSLGARQIRRLLCAAEEYLGTQPLGALTPMRFDVALVNGAGEVQVIENALAA